MTRFRIILIAAASLVSASAAAAPGFAAYSNGPPASKTFFPLMTWYQNPTSANVGGYANLATAMEAIGMNMLIGIPGSGGGGTPYPERFGSDDGEMALMKAHNLKAITGIFVPTQSNTGVDSVASTIAVATAANALSTLVGYNLGDEPFCSGGSPYNQNINNIPTMVTAVAGYDSTRPVFENFAYQPWLQPQYSPCSYTPAALAALAVISMDHYPTINVYTAQSIRAAPSNYLDTPSDNLFAQGLAVQSMRDQAPAGKAIWAYVEAGDGYGFSSNQSPNQILVSTTAGSTTVTRTDNTSYFTAAYVGLTLGWDGVTSPYTGPIPKGAKIVSVTDATHVVMDTAATATVTGFNPWIGGGYAFNLGTGGTGFGTGTGFFPGSDCIVARNLCLLHGNEYRPTLEQLNALIWESIIAGASGIEYFCQDGPSASTIADPAWCLGGFSGKADALAFAQGEKLINGILNGLAPILNGAETGHCSLRRINTTTGAITTASSCSNGVLTVTTNNTAGYGGSIIPARASVRTYNGISYLLVQSDQRGAASFTLTVSGLSGKVATVIYDSNKQYRPLHSAIGKAIVLNGSGAMADRFGDWGADYQTKIYAIQ